MNVRALLMVGCLCAAGCSSSSGGDPATAFVGKWTGTQTVADGTCSDGSTATGSSGAVELDIKESGADIQWSAACGLFSLGVSGNTATLLGPVTCAPAVVSGSTVTRTYRGFTLVLNGSALQLTGQVSAVVTTSSGSGTCTQGLSATLTKS